jgi:hypothetical protein
MGVRSNDNDGIASIRRALAELPETLDNTYARILQNIPKNHRKVAHAILQLLAVSFRPVTVEEVAVTSAVDYEMENFDHVLQQPRDPCYILKVCSGVVMGQPTKYYSHACYLTL